MDSALIDAPAQPSRIVTGEEAVRAAQSLMQVRSNQQAWPYPWIFPQQSAVRVHVEGVLAAPVAATQTQLISYQVPNGYQMAFEGVVLLYNGAGYVIGSTDITWVLDINTPLGGGVVQGYPVQGFSASNIPKGGIGGVGSGVFAPYPLLQPEILGPLDTLRAKVTTTVTIPAGAPNFFISIFEGWIWPDLDRK
jgi:hypothetical protein